MKSTTKKIKQFLALLIICNPSYAFDKITLTESTGLFSLEDKTVPLVNVNYIGWEANWKWASTIINPSAQFENNYVTGSFTGLVGNLGINFVGSVASYPSSNQIDWIYNWEFSQDHPAALGFGLEFNFNRSSAGLPSIAQSPVLLPDNQGWRWDTPDGQSVEVKFTPALAKIYFEGKEKSKIRAMFVTAINIGSKQTTMSVTVTPHIALSPPPVLNYDSVDQSQWHQSVLPENVSPIDLSFLNSADAPAGKHGFLKTNTDQLVFEDGTPAKFWGANVQAKALFSTDERYIKLHAKRIAQLGFNLVRIHHHDSKWVSPNIFNGTKSTLDLSLTSLKKLDLWISSLKNEGVYVWLDLHVGRGFTANDGILSFNEISHGQKRVEVKGFNYFNASIRDRMQEFNQAYLNHINPYTQLAYKDDPVVVGLLLTNENDLTHHYGIALTKKKLTPNHTDLFLQEARRFSDTNGFTLAATSRVWNQGEPKLFLNDEEHKFNTQMLDQLGLLGVKCPIATTSSWGGMGLSGLASLTDGSLIDVHSYGKQEEFNYNPRYYPGFLSWVAGAQVSGKPLSVTEWNLEPFPARDRFTAPIFTASLADLQGWDVMMLYGYSQKELNGGTLTGSEYSAFNDPAIMGLMPAAALLYRQNHVSLAKQTYELKLNRDEFFFNEVNPTTSKTIRTLLETSRLTVAVPSASELPWLKNNTAPSSDAIIINDSNKDFIPEGQNFVESDTNELKRDWVAGVQTINTKKSQIASGWIGGKSIDLDDVSFNITTKKAVIAVQSLENMPIKDSTRIFITAMARSQPITDDLLPFVSEPLSGTVTIQAPPGLQLYTVTNIGAQLKSRAFEYDSLTGKYTVDLKNADAHWLVLKYSL